MATLLLIPRTLCSCIYISRVASDWKVCIKVFNVPLKKGNKPNTHIYITYLYIHNIKTLTCRGMHAQLSSLRKLIQQLDPPLWSHFQQKDATNLFFCYRWILILFKREFNFDQVLRLWDGLFACSRDQLHLFLCVAVLERQRRHILEEDLDFDGLLALCVSLRGKIDLEVALRDAAMLKEYAGEEGRKAVEGLPW